jgi:hypothetical protein
MNFQYEGEGESATIPCPDWVRPCSAVLKIASSGQQSNIHAIPMSSSVPSQPLIPIIRVSLNPVNSGESNEPTPVPVQSTVNILFTNSHFLYRASESCSIMTSRVPLERCFINLFYGIICTQIVKLYLVLMWCEHKYIRSVLWSEEPT